MKTAFNNKKDRHFDGLNELLKSKAIMNVTDLSMHKAAVTLHVGFSYRRQYSEVVQVRQ